MSKRPSAVRTETVSPDEPATPAKRTVPPAAATTGVPVAAAMSMPRCWPAGVGVGAVAVAGDAPRPRRASSSPRPRTRAPARSTSGASEAGEAGEGCDRDMPPKLGAEPAPVGGARAQTVTRPCPARDAGGEPLPGERLVERVGAAAGELGDRLRGGPRLGPGVHQAAQLLEPGRLGPSRSPGCRFGRPQHQHHLALGRLARVALRQLGGAAPHDLLVHLGELPAHGYRARRVQLGQQRQRGRAPAAATRTPRACRRPRRAPWTARPACAAGSPRSASGRPGARRPPGRRSPPTARAAPPRRCPRPRTPARARTRDRTRAACRRRTPAPPSRRRCIRSTSSAARCSSLCSW